MATLCASVSVVRTARVFSATFDEPAHLAAGIQWLSTGRYYYDLQHPPLARVVAALMPFAAGARTVGRPEKWEEGAAILGSGTHYEDTLALARYGEVVFLLIGALAVWLWGRRLLGEAGGALATVFLVANPTFLAHTGLVTNDAAVASLGALAIFATLVWLDRPDWRHSIALGVAFALAITSKFSALPFVGAVLVAGYLLRGFVGHTWRVPGAASSRRSVADGPSSRRSVATEGPASRAEISTMKVGPSGAAHPRDDGNTAHPRDDGDTAHPRDYRTTGRAAIAIVVITMLLTIWAVYRFAFGRIWAVRFRVPAPALWAGLYSFLTHGGAGHPGYLLGHVGVHGWWFYFPIALLVKTPLFLLLLAAIGSFAAWRAVRRDGDWAAALPACGAIAILALSTQVPVNIGVRHVVPIYPLIAVLAAQGALFLWRDASRRRLSRAVAVLSTAALVTVPLRAFPDYLAYFNPLGGARPERVLVDSNLDWGQDLYRLRDTLRARGINGPVKLAYFGSSDPRAVGIPNAVDLPPGQPTTGWIAVSKTYLAGEWVGSGYFWLRGYTPVAPIGKSMLLWHLVAPPAADAHHQGTVAALKPISHVRPGAGS